MYPMRPSGGFLVARSLTVVLDPRWRKRRFDLAIASRERLGCVISRSFRVVFITKRALGHRERYVSLPAEPDERGPRVLELVSIGTPLTWRG